MTGRRGRGDCIACRSSKSNHERNRRSSDFVAFGTFSNFSRHGSCEGLESMSTCRTMGGYAADGAHTSEQGSSGPDGRTSQNGCSTSHGHHNAQAATLKRLATNSRSQQLILSTPVQFSSDISRSHPARTPPTALLHANGHTSHTPSCFLTLDYANAGPYSKSNTARRVGVGRDL